jgi:prepilin-type N-terminal cleavage/methylation domain-containing protein
MKNNHRPSQKSASGFTLVEVMVVVGIVSIISTGMMAMFDYMAQQSKAAKLVNAKIQLKQTLSQMVMNVGILSASPDSAGGLNLGKCLDLVNNPVCPTGVTVAFSPNAANWVDLNLTGATQLSGASGIPAGTVDGTAITLAQAAAWQAYDYNGSPCVGVFGAANLNRCPILVGARYQPLCKIAACTANQVTSVAIQYYIMVAKPNGFVDISDARVGGLGGTFYATATGGGGLVTATGLASYIPLFSTPNTLTWSNIYQNPPGVNAGWIGISAVAPGTPATAVLDVQGTFNAAGNTTVGTAITPATLGVTGATTLGSTLGVTGATTLGSTLGVTGATTLGSTLDVTGTAAIATSLTGGTNAAPTTLTVASPLNVNGATSLATTLDVKGTAAIATSLSGGTNAAPATLTVASPLTVTGATTVNNTLGITGNTTIAAASTLAVGTTILGQDKLTMTGTGNISIDSGTNLITLANGNVSANSHTYTSDRRLKENIQPLSNSLEKILQIEGVSFNFIGRKETQLGFIAQQIEPIFPETVSKNPVTGMKSVQYANLIAPVIEGIKTQQQMIEDQQKLILQMQGTIQMLQLKVEALEQQRTPAAISGGQ